MSQELQIDATILSTLKSSGQYLVPEETLMQTVRLRVSPKPEHSEIKERISFLDSRQRISTIRGDYGAKYGISDQGRAWLKENA